MTQCQGPDLRRFFLVFTYIWQEDLAKISKVLGAPRNVNLARSKTWLVSVTIYCTIFQSQFTSTLPVFTRRYTFEKKSARVNAR